MAFYPAQSTPVLPTDTDVGRSLRVHHKHTPVKNLVIACRGKMARDVLDAAVGLMFGDNVSIVTILLVAPEEAKLPSLANQTIALKGYESFTDPQEIVSIAKRANACCVHPGTGELSRNPELHRLLSREGISCITSESTCEADEYSIQQYNRALDVAARPHKRGRVTQHDKNVNLKRRFGRFVDILKSAYPLLALSNPMVVYHMLTMARNGPSLPADLRSVVWSLNGWVPDVFAQCDEALAKAGRMAAQYGIGAQYVPLLGSVNLFMSNADHQFSLRARMNSWTRFQSINLLNCLAFTNVLYTAICMMPHIRPTWALERITEETDWAVTYFAAQWGPAERAKMQIGQTYKYPYFITGTQKLRVLIDRLEHSESVVMDPHTDMPSFTVDYSQLVIYEVWTSHRSGVKLQYFEDGNKKPAHVLIVPLTYEVFGIEEDERTGRVIVKIHEVELPLGIEAEESEHVGLIADLDATKKRLATMAAEVAMLEPE